MAEYLALKSFIFAGRHIKPHTKVKIPDDLVIPYLQKNWLIPAVPVNFEDILISKIRFPDRVYIVGTGPRGESHFKRIPEGAFIILVNMAILTRLPGALWMATDPLHASRTPEYQWFTDEVEKYKGRVDIGCQDIKPGALVPAFDRMRIANHFPWVKCVYDTGSCMFRGSNDLTPNIIRCGATIAGQAIQLAYFKQSQEIILVGIDMFGDQYFGGRMHRDRGRANRNWSQIVNMNKLIAYLERKKIRMASLSDTQLTIKRI